jgi:hypothetical protein
MREKLIELLMNMPDLMMGSEGLADYLIANGVVVSESEITTKTNADRIRAMSDEELAQELALVAGWDRQEYEKAKRIGIEKVMLDWLKQPTEE